MRLWFVIDSYGLIFLFFFKLDMKYLSPLLLAYEDRIREKEDLNLEHEASCHLKKIYFSAKAEINLPIF